LLSERGRPANGSDIAGLGRDVAVLQLSYQSLEKRVTDSQAALERDMGQMRSEMSSGMRDLQTHLQLLSERMAAGKQINWAPIGIATTALLMVGMGSLTFAWSSISQQQQAALSPLQSAVSVLQRDVAAGEQRSTASDSALHKRVDTEIGSLHRRLDDRQQESNSRYERLLESLNRNSEMNARLDEGLVEVETQFRAMDGYNNLRFVNMHRWVSVIYEKLFGSDYPDIFIEPTIARDRVTRAN
jgi:hypothetical protein